MELELKWSCKIRVIYKILFLEKLIQYNNISAYTNLNMLQIVQLW
jgi:hypothetical protein